MTSLRARGVGVMCAAVLLGSLSGCVYYNTFYLAKRYYQRSFDDVPYALDKSDLSNTPQFTRSIDLSKKVVAQYPKSKYVDDAYLLWAKNLIATDDPRQSARMLEDFDALYPKSPMTVEASFYLGVAYLRARKYEQSLRTFDAYLARYPKHRMAPYAYFERSRALLALDQPDEAAKSVGQIIEHFPKSRLALRARVARAEALVAQNAFDAAREDYRELGRRALTDDDRLEYLLDEADCLMGGMKNDEAMSLLKDAIAHEHEPARADTTGGRFIVAPTGPGVDRYGRLLVRIGMVHMRSNRLDDAVAAYRRVMEDYPHTPLAAEAQYRLGYAYETVGDDFDRAKAEYGRVRDQGPNPAFSEQAATRAANLDRLAKYRSATGDSLGRAAEGGFLLAEQYLFQLDKPDRALEQYRKIEHDFAGTEWAAKALNAQAWVLTHKLKQTAAADSLLWRVVNEHPGTEAQLAARDYLERQGIVVPSELIKLPEHVFTHADSVRADSVVAAAADTSTLTPIPQGSMPLGTTTAPADSLRLGIRHAPFALPPIVPPGAPEGVNVGGTEGGTPPSPSSIDSTRLIAPMPMPVPSPEVPGVAPAAPDTTRAPSAPPDTTRAPSAPDTTGGIAPHGSSRVSNPLGARITGHAAVDTLAIAKRAGAVARPRVGGTAALAAKREAGAVVDTIARAAAHVTGDSARVVRDSARVAADSSRRIVRPDTTHATAPNKTRRGKHRPKAARALAVPAARDSSGGRH